MGEREENRSCFDWAQHERVSSRPTDFLGLRKCGDFTVYFTEEAIDGWHSSQTGKRGRPQIFVRTSHMDVVNVENAGAQSLKKSIQKKSARYRLLPALLAFTGGCRKGLPVPPATCGIPVAHLRAIPDKTASARRGIRE
jgi:hypothetical protein